MIVYLVQGDTQPVRFRRFRDQDGADVLTSDVSTVVFSLKNRSTGVVKVSAAACSITSASSEALSCAWAPGATDLDTAGEYDVELRVTYSNGKIKRYPEQSGAFIVNVRANIV